MSVTDDKLEALTQQLTRLANYLDDQGQKQNNQPTANLRAVEAVQAAEYGVSSVARITPPDPQPFQSAAGAAARMPDMWAPPVTNTATDQDHGASIAGPGGVQSGGQSQTSMMGGLLGARENPTDPNALTSQDEQALTWSMLGEHGGPALIRNPYLESYGIQRTLKWAAGPKGQDGGALSQAQDFLDNSRVPGTGAASAALGGLQGLANTAQNHPGWTFAAYKASQQVGNLWAHLGNAQDVGQSLGYSPTGTFGTPYAIAGFRNPLSRLGQAGQVGTAFDYEKMALEGRNPFSGQNVAGLTHDQASSAVDELASQGFSMNPQISPAGNISGDAATIAQGYMKPLMQQYPGLSAQDLGQFDPYLRNAGTSVQQLTEQLKNLGGEAQASKENLSEYASSVAATGAAFEALGSTPQGGAAIGTGFTDVTGMDPQIAGQLGQNPLVQGFMTSKFGVLPSGIGDMNPGVFAGSSEQLVGYMQHALSGLNRDKYTTVNGRRVLVERGSQAEADQIAQMTGLPSNVVNRMIGDRGPINARTQTAEMLGGRGTGGDNGTGFFGYLDQHKGVLHGQEYQDAEAQWKATVDPTLKASIGTKAMKQLDSIKGMGARAEQLRKDLATASKNDPWNQIQNKSNKSTVHVQLGLTPQAAKLVQQVNGGGPSNDKRNNNAGGPPINVPMNSHLGWSLPDQHIDFRGGG